ncbi:MAG TPA: ABC transporter permease [Actinomycetota bacterium]|nr:ABC transporter permease [Actinomycetota bacterium]
MSAEAGFFSRVAEWFADPANWQGTFGIPNRLQEHVVMSAVSVGIAAAIALPVGLWVGHRRRFELLVVSTSNVGRAIPSFGLLFLFVVAFGLGLRSPASLRPPIIFALVLLAIPPILTNTYVGVQSVDDDTLEAARGMGMSERSVLFRIEVPLGVPLILGGLRTAAVQVVATATLGAVVAGGGLGRYIVDGFAAGDRVQVFAGAVLVAALALATELALAVVERSASPRTRSAGRAGLLRHAAQAGRPGGW